MSGDTVYLEDLDSTVFALDLRTGALRWERRFVAPNGGPNGLAVAGGRVYGATDAAAFALSARTGRVLWERRLASASEQFVDVAPVAWKGMVFLGTVGYTPLGRGTIYALDAADGRVRWRFDTIEGRWRHPLRSGGGGIWYPVSVDSDGLLYAGNSNPTPWGGTPRLPNGAAFPGPARYTDSLIVLDARTGKLSWYDQVTPHDVRDYDFEATPVLANVGHSKLVIGAGKAGEVIAWDRTTHRRRWTADVGTHRNDVGPLPRRRVVVCPGLYGGVATPMAYSKGRVFVPTVDLCGWGSAVGEQAITSVHVGRGRGEIVALDADNGRTIWDTRLPSPPLGCTTVVDDVVFTATYAGVLYALDARNGTVVWHARLPAGVNGCPSVADNILIVGAGVRSSPTAQPTVLAFGLPR